MPRPAGIYDLVIDGALAHQQEGTGGDSVTVDLATGATDLQTGPVGTIRFDGPPARLKRLEIWLPWNEATRLVALRTNAPVEAPESDGRRLWLHHGSSISHGSNAASPTGTWPAHAALRAGVDPAETAAGKLTLEIIRDELVRLTGQRATDDPNLHYLDGRELYGEADSVKLPLSDELHRTRPPITSSESASRRTPSPQVARS